MYLYVSLVSSIFMIQKRGMSSDFIDIIKARGFVHQFTDEEGLRTLLSDPKQNPQRAYIGFDCTAPSLHVGSLLQIMLLRWWQKCGHTPIVLLGGGTTKIGDPSGKDESRPPLSDEAIQKNMAGLRGVFDKILNTGSSPIYVNNADWMDSLASVAFMRDYGRFFSVNRMLTMDSVNLRLEREQPLSLLEFMYMVYQAYDFVELNKRYNCRVQMGGADQWGNIIQGIELHHSHLIHNEGMKPAIFVGDDATKKALDHHRSIALFGITSPLITTSSGAKMGKTAAGAIWLNEDLLSAYDYWQFWRNTEDGDVKKFLQLFTEIPLTEKERKESPEQWEWSIERLETEGKLQGAAINAAKIILATEATRLLHGPEKAEAAAKTAAETFSGSGVSETLPEVLLPSLDIPVYEALVKAGFAKSNSEARTLIKGKGVKVNDKEVAEETARLSTDQRTADGYIKLSAGKKRHALVKLVTNS